MARTKDGPLLESRGLTVESGTTARMNAMLGVTPAERNRSRQYRRVLDAGMTALYGEGWEERADAIIATYRARAEAANGS